MAHRWKTYRLLLCLMMLIAAFPIIHAQAQTEGLAHGCDSAVIPAIAATTTQLDYAAMCQQVLDCEGELVLCRVEAALDVEEACDDELCKTRVRLYAAVMGAFDPITSWGIPDANTLSEGVLSALTAFEAEDYAAAQEAFGSIPYEVAIHPLLNLSAGLAAEASGDETEALAIYDESATQTETYPLVFYVRGDLFARMGHTEAAAADFATFEDYVAPDPELSAIANQLTADFPLSNIAFEDWLVYPVLYSGGGPGGGWAYDESLSEPTAFRLANIEGGARLIIDGSPPSATVFGMPAPRYVLMSQNEVRSYRAALKFTDDYGVWGVDITLDLNSGIGMDSTLVFESGSSRHYLVAPEGQPDPREQFDVFRCEGGAISRLKIDARGYLAEFDGAALVDAPAGQAIGEIERFSGFTVLQGPECVGDQAWWQVESDDGGAVGWIAENEGFKYRVLPTEDVAIPMMLNENKLKREKMKRTPKLSVRF